MAKAKVARPEEITAERRPYTPYGACRDLMLCKDSEIIISGPAGTGKSCACMSKLYLCAVKPAYAGMRGLILRKTRESVSESALVTWEDHVVPAEHPILNGPNRHYRQSYSFPNGSEIVVAGMDKPSKIMSTEYDVIYVQESIELTEAEWEMLTTRLRHGVMPYQQIIGDTNPDRPTHWIKRRAEAGKLKLLEGRHEDNPTVTPEYLAKLDALTGPRKLRLRYGRWVQAEGVVYEGWDAAVHVVDRFEIPASWDRYWAIDFGFTAPFVWLAFALDPDGRLYCYREIYWTKRLVEDHARHIRELVSGEPRPKAIICDHDAEDRATLMRHLDMVTVPAWKAVGFGIQSVATRLRQAGDGKARLFFLRDSLVARDPALVEAKKPTSVLEEWDGYIWREDAGLRRGEEPLKQNDHGMDAVRYMCASIDQGTIYYGRHHGDVVLNSELDPYRYGSRETVRIAGIDFTFDDEMPDNKPWYEQ
jgi:PBSX family phage terminase large subunit